MNCPLDHTPLLPHRRSGAELHTCLQCHGVWFARAALETLAPRAASPATPTAGGATVLLRRWPCPACAASALRTQMRGEVEVTSCPDCRGVWLPKSEAQKILSRPPQHGPVAAPAAGIAPDQDGPGKQFLVEAAGRASWIVAGEAGDSCAVLAEFLTVWA